jgi:hypothetical protein
MCHSRNLISLYSPHSNIFKQKNVFFLFAEMRLQKILLKTKLDSTSKDLENVHYVICTSLIVLDMSSRLRQKVPYVFGRLDLRNPNPFFSFPLV